MARVADNNFLTIEGWMRTSLNLSGNELIVFAVIYQFSQGKAGRYIGGLPYLADWCGCHADTARRAVRNLEERGLIIAQRGEVNGIPYCNYIVCGESLQNTRVSLQNTTDPLAKYEGDTCKMQGITINRTINKNKEQDNNIGRFIPPTQSEVEAYCRERGNSVDAQHFVDYYEANGWRVGRNPMKDWRAAVRTWESNRKTPNPRPYPQQPRQLSPEEKTLAALARLQARDGNLNTFDEQ